MKVLFFRPITNLYNEIFPLPHLIHSEENQTLLKQFSIILSIYFLGELLQKAFSLPVPGNVIGMLLLFFCLSAGIIKLEMIDKISGFLLDNLAFFFLPAGVSLITCFTLLEGKWTAILEISVLSTVVILAVTGLTVEFVKKYLNKGQPESGYPEKPEATLEKAATETKAGTVVNTGSAEPVQRNLPENVSEHKPEHVQEHVAGHVRENVHDHVQGQVS